MIGQYTLTSKDLGSLNAPIKERKIKKTETPSYMNGELRHAIYKKHRLFNKYKKCRTSLN